MKHIKLLFTVSLLTSYGSICPSASASAGSGISENASRSHALTAEEERAMHEQLLAAVRTGNLDVVQQYITAGTNLDASDQDDGYTALMEATVNNCTEMARLLIDAGADVDLVDQNGWTALIYSARYNSPEIARLLIDAGADVDLVTQDGSTALMFAAVSNRPEIARLLIAAGANVDLVNQNGSTALIYAAKYNCSEIVRLLIAASADPTIQTNPTTTGQFALQLVPTGNTPEEIANNNALRTELENWYEQYTNPGLK